MRSPPLSQSKILSEYTDCGFFRFLKEAPVLREGKQGLFSKTGDAVHPRKSTGFT